MAGTIGGGRDTKREGQVHAGRWAHLTKATLHTVLGVTSPGEPACDWEPLEDGPCPSLETHAGNQGDDRRQNGHERPDGELAGETLLIVAGTSRAVRRPSPGRM